MDLTPSGRGVSAPSPASLALLADAHEAGKTSELLFTNYSDAIGDFSDPLAEKMLDSPTNRAAVIRALVAEVKRNGWDGITIDLESLNGFGEAGHLRDDNVHLDEFTAALKKSLGTSKSVSICVSAWTGSYADLGYDLPTLSRHVDNVVLMAYDQHGPQWTNAGPVGGYPWVRVTLSHLLRLVPKHKVQLGIAQYGYSWPDGKKADKGGGATVTDAQARALVATDHATAVWSSTQKEWTATLSDGTVLWWSDHRSFEARIALARSLGLGGAAVWSLRYADPL